MTAGRVEILYEDNHVLVIRKPQNMPSQGDSSGDLDVTQAMKAYLKEKYNKPGEVYLGLVHRLDRPVGGLMVLARTGKAAERLSRQVKERTMHRTYLALVQGRAGESGRLTDYLLKDARTNTVRAVEPQTPGAREARLTYQATAFSQGLSLLEVALETGRSHQIRVQLSHAGLPIWGDARYGGGKPGEQIALYGAFLDFEHPTKHVPMHFTALPPQTPPWGLFRAEMDLLAKEKENRDSAR